MNKELSVYIHWPFCEKKCPYCDFNSHVAGEVNQSAWVEAYKHEIDFWIQKYNSNPKDTTLRSIFFGGGTPSLMQAETIARILEHLKTYFVFQDGVEITMEANPSSSEVSKFRDFKTAGINRISIGVQALNDNDLKYLGRIHGKDEALRAIEAAMAVFDNYSFDLIYARHQGHTLAQWQEELEFALKYLAKSHVSLYTLTIEKGTEFFKLHSDGKIMLPKNGDDFYDMTNDITTKYGFENYEISNYAKRGSECRHNISYWTSIDYFGIGPGAHGRLQVDGKRFVTQNFSAPQKYLDLMQKNGEALQLYQELCGTELVNEILMMNLRYRDGIDFLDIKNRIGVDILSNLDSKKLAALAREGLIERDSNIIKTTAKGRNVTDGIVKFLMA